MFKRKRITVLGVSLLAALGLMSVSAAGAQAGKWTIDGKAVSEAAKFESEGGVVTIIGGGVTIKCAKQRGIGTLFTGGTGEASLIFYDCAIPGSTTCLIPKKEIHLTASMTLNENGSQVVLTPNTKYANQFSKFTMISVEGECALFVGEQTEVGLAGKMVASVGAAAVKLTLSTSNSGFWVGLWGMTNSEIKASSSMWLTGVNAGKVLGTTS